MNLISSHDLYIYAKIIRLIVQRDTLSCPLYPSKSAKSGGDPARAFRWIRSRRNLGRLEGRNSRTKAKQIVTKLVWDGRQSILARRRTSIPVRWGSGGGGGFRFKPVAIISRKRDTGRKPVVQNPAIIFATLGSSRRGRRRARWSPP